MRRNHFDNDETEILVIPDLEEDAEDESIAKGEQKVSKLAAVHRE